MLPKKERLSREEFNRFFSMGKRLHFPHMLLVFVPYPKLHASVVVAKKIVKHAVKRNKIRRRIYDIVRRYRERDPVSGVFIFLTKAGIQNITYEVEKEEVEKAMEEAIKKFNQ